MKTVSQVYLSVGSNIGDRHANCTRGIELVNDLVDSSVKQVSAFYYTEPVDFTDQGWFVNGAFELETGLDPSELMVQLKKTENRVGQFEKDVRFGPRILDLDIIFFGSRVIAEEHLTVPHPRMEKRCFVLKPLCDIASKFVHPVSGVTIEYLLREMENTHGQEVKPYPGH
ncbi:MAG: 2-amino-4-hydroxy-6-hydroxymethyldihydropteridine diphosphokinase [Desulfobacteraceae bacterium]